MAKNNFKKVNTKLFKYLISILFLGLLALFYSYKNLDVPMGLTADETAMGYNAVLLSHNYHDENGRFLPLFVLSNEGTDWKQPITQYYLAILFKIFSPSLFLLRFSSVIIVIVSTVLLYKLVRQQQYSIGNSIFGILIFLSTPLIMIQSHMGLDNIMPIPFILIWIYFLFKFQKTPKFKYLIISALSLGITFYTYKGMRAVFPIWYLITILYLFIPSKKYFLVFIFSAFALPFMFISPLINHLYPGSIFGGARPQFDSIYNFIYPYLSSFDPTFLFIKGDETLYHSTGIHGMFLLSTMPIFLFGIYSSITKNKNSRFLLALFFFAPMLYGSVNSVHRASRLMCLIPLYAIISINGLILIKSIFKKYYILILAFLLILISANYIDFLFYYYNTYAKLTQSVVGDLKPYLSFEYLKNESVKTKLTPYVAKDISNPFYESIYFPNGITKIHEDRTPPPKSILLSNRKIIDGMNNINSKMRYYYLQEN